MPRDIFVRLKALIVRDDGQDLIEYSLLVALIALVAVGAIGSVGDTLNTLWWVPISDAFSG
jgi:Flp pilus assembly pilin Flp